ncbi:MAG: 3-oxoacid CoA-transferase [Oscillospiraceae bacterium]|nr:3-oxoacid CoA-transferase [Oscillospiraceae bacterium]
MVKFIPAQEAVGLIRDNATVGVGGFGAYCGADELFVALAERFKETRHPANITIVAGICTGDNSREPRGLNRLAEPGLIGTVFAAHLANPPLISEMVGGNRVPGYTLPLGVILHLFRAIAGKKPGVLTHVGLNTFADPRVEGCKANDLARAQNREVVELVNIGGKECLFYPSFNMDVCLIRGTYADEDGNISMDHEALMGPELELAAAVHNCGGIVICQVEEIVLRGTIHPKRVRIHNSLVDYVVKATPQLHRQGYATDAYRPELSGELRCPANAIKPMELSIRKVIARRAAMELRPDMVINLGIGIPSGVGSVANEENIAGQLTLSLESGPIGGVPVEGVGFAAAVNPESICNICDMLDCYDGGLLSMTCLGSAEIDENGNVNVSRFGIRCTGPGGFINISQTTPKVCFLGAFTAGKCDVEIKDGSMNIKADGTGIKFIKKVQQITFSADYARKTSQDIMYITERAVFRLVEGGIMLTEIAPGIDLQKDILDKMEFKPLIAKELKTMDERIFRVEKMGLRLN